MCIPVSEKKNLEDTGAGTEEGNVPAHFFFFLDKSPIGPPKKSMQFLQSMSEVYITM